MSAEETVKTPKFKPHMLDHVHEGCPANSSCLPQTGKRYKKWVDLLKRKLSSDKRLQMLNNFRRKSGIPLEIWSFPTAEGSEGLIHWDSRCSNHNKDGKKIQISLSLAQDFKELKKLEKESSKIYITRSFLLEKEGTIVEYMIPRESTPLYLEGQHLIYTRETEGHYYGLSIAPDGSVQVLPVKGGARDAKTVDCPAKLVQRFAAADAPAELYREAYCKAFWNQKSKMYQTMIFGWSCP